MEAVATTLSLQDFLEKTLCFGPSVEVHSLFSNQRAPRHYSAAKGLRTAALDSGFNQDRWIGMHLAEEPGTVLYNAFYERDNFLHTLHRVENYVQKKLLPAGLQLTDRLIADPQLLDNWLITIDEYLRQRRADSKAQVRVESSITMKRLNTELNWDVVIRFALWVDGEDAFIQLRIPSIVSEVSRLITLIQGEHTRAAVTRFLHDFDKHGEVFGPLPELDPATVIVHHLIHKPDALADTVYGIYKSSVQVLLNRHWDLRDQERVRALKAWEHMDRAYQLIWSGAVEVARVHLNTYLAFNKTTFPQE
jgi:hypothetical protein